MNQNANLREKIKIKNKKGTRIWIQISTCCLWISMERAKAFLFVNRFFGLKIEGLWYSLPRYTITANFFLDIRSTETKTPPLSASSANATPLTCSKVFAQMTILTNSRYFQWRCMFSTVPSNTPRLPDPQNNQKFWKENKKN